MSEQQPPTQPIPAVEPGTPPTYVIQPDPLIARSHPERTQENVVYYRPVPREL